jgi:hypothetical protein
MNWKYIVMMTQTPEWKYADSFVVLLPLDSWTQELWAAKQRIASL